MPGELADIVEIVPVNDDINYGHFNMTMKYLGLVTFSWDNAELRSVDDLFNVRIRAKSDVFISELISLTNTITPALMSLDGDEMPVGIDYIEKSDNLDATVLFQNTPNPWSERTIIKFVLPAQQKATVTVMDANGRVIWEVSDVFQRGVNSVEIFRSKLLEAGGLMYYQLKTDDLIQTRKMLML